VIGDHVARDHDDRLHGAIVREVVAEAEPEKS